MATRGPPLSPKMCCFSLFFAKVSLEHFSPVSFLTQTHPLAVAGVAAPLDSGGLPLHLGCETRIIAAVLGIIHTMAIVDSGAAMVGKSVAAALTGTLLGVLGAYGFVNPTAAKVKANNNLESQYFMALMKGLCGFAQGLNPVMAVEVSRRCLDHHMVPSAEQLEEILKGAGK